MASSVPSLDELVDNTLCCAQWRAETEHVGRLSCTFPTTSSRVFCKICFSPTSRAALFRLCVPVALKTSGKDRKTPLYVYIEPQHISHLQSLPLDDSEATQACVSDLVAHCQECSSPADIVVLQFLLKEPATVVGPKESTSIEPRSEATGRILESLHSLSLATNLTLYVPKTEPLMQYMDELCTGALTGSIGATPKVSHISALYNGVGGVDIGAQLSAYAAAAPRGRSPPAYQDLSHTPEASTTQSDTNSSPAPSRADIPSSTFRGVKRKRVDQSSGSGGTGDALSQRSWMRRIEQRLLDLDETVALLRDEVADLRREREMERAAPLAFPTAHAVVTRSISRARPDTAATTRRLDMVEWHLQRVHRRLQASERYMRKVDDDCNRRHDELDRTVEDRLDDFDAELDQRISDTCEEGFDTLFDSRFDEKLDERWDSLRVDLEDHIRDRLDEAELSIRESIKDGINATL